MIILQMENFVKRMPREGDSDELSPFATVRFTRFLLFMMFTMTSFQERQARRIVKKEEYKVPTLDDITTLLKVVREESNVKVNFAQSALGLLS